MTDLNEKCGTPDCMPTAEHPFTLRREVTADGSLILSLIHPNGETLICRGFLPDPRKGWGPADPYKEGPLLLGQMFLDLLRKYSDLNPVVRDEFLHVCKRAANYLEEDAQRAGPRG